MNLYEDEKLEQENIKSKKTMKIITIILVILLILSIAVLGYIYYLKNKELKVYIDGKLVKTQENVFLFDGEDVYVSIKDISQMVGYTANNGEYKRPYSEDTTKCYLDNNYETVSYILDSNTIYKALIENKSSNIDYEYYTIDKPVILSDNKLYTTTDGISIGCNLSISYTQSNNTIKIYTLPYLTNYYSTKIKESAINYEKISYANQKAVLHNMIIVKSESGKYGVNNLKNEIIIGEKYKSITFVESSQEFVVETDEGKVGIISKDATTKIEPEYDSIKQIDNESGLYVVSNNGKYGVVNKNGKIVIHLDYDAIGIDTTQFQSDSLDNNYLIYGKCIPVKRAGKWGMLDKNGNTILSIIYDGFGCQISNSKNSLANNLLLIPEYEAIVVCKDKLYGLFNSSGKELIQALVTDMYSITTSGEKMYYLTYQGDTINIIEYLKTWGINPVTEEESALKNNSTTNESSNQTNDTNDAKNTTNTTNETNTENNVTTNANNV